MASTSSSSVQKSFKYDVFLSFRGEDTRKNFVDNLFHALKQKGIYTYKDDEEIKKGKTINDELIKSIKDSKSYIIVFSKNYASSSWCLNELVKIMECHKTNGQTVYPVFYDVEPTEVRNQSGAVGEAFAKHVNEVKIGRWKHAMKQATGLAGWELKNTFDGHEAKFIQNIVEEISRELRIFECNVDGKLVGMEKRVEDVVSYLRSDIYDVRMIGIKGMGGAGKTTLARAVFDQISFQFEGSSFVENVRENSKNLSYGLKSLQKQVLSDVINEQNINLKSVNVGKKMIKQRMCGRKVLVVLDDVDHIDQLEALVGDPSWFKPGSRVIITTREEQVLMAHGVPVNMILDVNLLSHQEANCLFNRYAFGTDIPNQDYKVLTDQVIRYAAGLPLTIKVLGSFLRGKDELEWTDALERLKTIPLKQTLEILELSYTGLEEDYKEIFLDVACILKGWEKERAIRALESCNLHARTGLRVLEQKSLITLSASGCLGMHDHIVEMGKNIVRRLYPNMPYRHSRLWINEEIEDLLVEDKGTEATRCMKVKLLDPVIVMKGLRKMKELGFLEVNGTSTSYFGRGFDYDNIDEDTLHLPNSLRYLCWDGYPFTCLPKTFLANNLVDLEMSYSNIGQLWKDGEKKVLKKLRFIDLNNCKLRTLDIGLTMNLERLCLEQCSNLVELHMPIESSKFNFISISHCKLIRTLNLVRVQNLVTLKVEGCDNLVELHMHVNSPKLKHLSLKLCNLKNLNLRQARNLEVLDLVCEHLVELHMPGESSKLTHLSIQCFMLKTLNLRHTRNLERLDLIKCMHLVELHMPIESSKLTHLSIQCFMLKTLNLRQTLNLEELDLVKCMHLVELHMPVESYKLKSVKLYCSNLRTLDLGLVENLDKLDIEEHDCLVKLHLASVKTKELRLIKCSNLKIISLTWTRNLETLYLAQCISLVELHMPIESHELKIIEIHSSKLRTLDLTLSLNLKSLYLLQCEDLLKLHMPIESPKLKSMVIDCLKLRSFHLGQSPYLEHLDLHSCSNLVEFHTLVGCLSGSVRFKPCSAKQGYPMDGSLAELHLIARSLGICPLHPENDWPKFYFECIYNGLPLSFTEYLLKQFSLGLCACTNFASLSGTICGLQIRKLTLEGGIPEVPKDFDQLEYLEELSLLSTKIEHFPVNIFMMKHLKVLRFKSCWFLKQLPEDIGRLELLEELHITNCTSLRDIPNSICEMKRLKCLYLTNCILVEKLPKEIGRLKCLTELNIQGTGITDFPPSIFELEDLLFLF